MAITFYKFQGAGNDFVLIDDRDNRFEAAPAKRQQLIERFCNRNFGAGADGLMLLKSAHDVDFEMQYFNSDGLPGSFCGNGARCIVAFADLLGLAGPVISFIASDGLHSAVINGKTKVSWDISVQMTTIQASPLRLLQGDVIHTGSPHIVLFRDSLDETDVYQEGKTIRYSEKFAPAGVNVNFAVLRNQHYIELRTYERGVENETLACGTGATAAALAAWYEGSGDMENHYTIQARGGALRVRFKAEKFNESCRFSDIWLSGPAHLVYKAETLAENISQEKFYK